MKVGKFVSLSAMLFLAGCAANMGTAMRYYNSGDYGRAYTQLRRLADKGDANAQYQLGHIYAYGEGVAQNYAEALTWLEKAAANGSVNAQTELGGMYEQGKGVPRDYSAALKWYRKATVEGDAEAPADLGDMYLHGFGIAKDLKKAAACYQLAGSRGNLHAELFLAWLYKNGYYGFQKDTVKSNAILTDVTRLQFSSMAKMREGIHDVIFVHMEYTKTEIRAGMSGIAVIGFYVKNQKPFDIQLVKSSGYPPLDETAVQMVKDSVFPSAPVGYESKQLYFKVPINFQLVP